jgi:histidine triad (HIT) family protein
MGRSSLLKIKLLQWLLMIARWRPLRPAVRFFFKTMVHRFTAGQLRENEYWVAFHHPQPAYPLHILILPKGGNATLSEAPEEQPTLYAALFAIAKDLIQAFNLDTRGYRLITNGGPNQSIPQWHWHLISEEIEEKNA